ncbi:MAG: transposase [Niabella sp.]|nr:transposase [Niabella sp.]
MLSLITEYPAFFTATNLDWKALLKPDKYKDIIISSLRFLVNAKRVKIFAFVIMRNHIHLIWQMMPDHGPDAVQRDFLKYTAQRIRKTCSVSIQTCCSTLKLTQRTGNTNFGRETH